MALQLFLLKGNKSICISYITYKHTGLIHILYMYIHTHTCSSFCGDGKKNVSHKAVPE